MRWGWQVGMTQRSIFISFLVYSYHLFSGLQQFSHVPIFSGVKSVGGAIRDSLIVDTRCRLKTGKTSGFPTEWRHSVFRDCCVESEISSSACTTFHSTSAFAFSSLCFTALLNVNNWISASTNGNGRKVSAFHASKLIKQGTLAVFDDMQLYTVTTPSMWLIMTQT